VISEAPPESSHHGDWPRRWRRSEHLRRLVGELLASDPADIVLGQLDAGAGAMAGAREAGVPGVLLLAGYESLCRYAFAPGSQCSPVTRCRACPRALALAHAERHHLWKMRSEQDAALASAALLVAPSRTMAGACERMGWRRPWVAAPVVRAPGPAHAEPGGAVVFASSVWSIAKGVGLLAPIARRLSHRSVVIQAPNGLADEYRRTLAGLANVTLRERASEIGPVLEGAAVLLVPSQHAEPFGRVAFEALAAGVPTLASATGGLAEYVPHQQLVGPFEDADAWARAVRALERRPAWDAARRRGAAAAARVLATSPAERIEHWLADVVAGRRSTALARQHRAGVSAVAGCRSD
jgi:glycosyltransferase involved in cell wall biosynthesis